MKVGFCGAPKLVHLYPYMLDEPWLETVPRPPDDAFDGLHAVLLTDVHFTKKSGVTHSARAGLVTDGGTVKGMYRAASTPYRQYLPCYLLHDELSKRAREMYIEGVAQVKAGRAEQGMKKVRSARKFRLYADKLLREMVRAAGGSRIKAALIYVGVRCGALASFPTPSLPGEKLIPQLG